MPFTLPCLQRWAFWLLLLLTMLFYGISMFVNGIASKFIPKRLAVLALGNSAEAALAQVLDQIMALGIFRSIALGVSEG